MPTVRSRIETIVATIKGWPSEAVIGTTPLDQENGHDNLDRIELMLGLENEFDIALCPPDVDWCKTVDDVVGVVSDKVKTRANP